MPVRRKQAKKSRAPVDRVEPADKAALAEKLRLVAEDAKKLDAHIKHLTETLVRSHFRIL
jgi:hypothetical protein